MFFPVAKVDALRARLASEPRLQARWSSFIKHADELAADKLVTFGEADAGPGMNANYGAASEQMRKLGLTLWLAWRVTREERAGGRRNSNMTRARECSECVKPCSELSIGGRLLCFMRNITFEPPQQNSSASIRLRRVVRRAALAFAATCSLVANARIDVPQWSVHEIPLTAARSHKNPYTDIAVTATFSGPGGAVKTVKGFWDGGQAFKVRFTPDQAGTWTYSIVASPADPGLIASGEITATAPTAGNHGFVRVDAANPYSFVWDDGARYFMFGQTYYDVMLNVAAGGGWKTAVDRSAAHGINKIRLHVYPHRTYGQSSPPGPVEATTYPEAIPYRGPSSSPNRDQLNIPFWQNLDEYVKYLEAKGVVADLILFNTYVKWGARHWGTQAQDERFLRYVLARYGAFHNVIWCVSNEWAASRKSQEYIDTLGSIVRNEDPWIAKRSFLRPLSVHQNTRIDFQFFGSSWPTHAIIQYGIRNKETVAADEFKNTGQTKYHNGDEWGNAGIVYNLGRNMPVVNDEYGYLGDATPINLTQTQHRWSIWGIATAGGYISIGDNRHSPTGTPEISGDWLDAPEYGDIKRLVDFFTTKGLAYWKMTSQNSINPSGTRVYVLAETGRQYLIYAAVGGTFAIDIAPGKYVARRYNPRTGEDAMLGELNGAGSRSFTMPDANDWVVYLKASAEPL